MRLLQLEPQPRTMVVTCGLCNGEGWIIQPNDAPFSSTTVRHGCKLCKGTGRREVPESLPEPELKRQVRLTPTPPPTECRTCEDTGWMQRDLGGGAHADPEPCTECEAGEEQREWLENVERAKRERARLKSTGATTR